MHVHVHFTTQLFAFAYLIEKIVEFRQASRDQRSTSSLFDAFIKSIPTPEKPKSSRDRIFDSIRTLGSLLQDFSLFKLEPTGPDAGTNKAYGIGTQQIQVGDVMIPVWGLMLGYDSRIGVLNQEGSLISMSTMFALRRVGKQSSQRSTHAPSDEKDAEAGRIVGSAVCVLIEPTSCYDNDLSSVTNLADMNGEEQCFMQLV